ncbi:MAG: cobalamin-dependent protein [Deltaproteobacteria bacterium]|uniref:Cobalamin-dependent protein n=1 Tax=Candidatus Zymogenus saltonus TaxID=2844893 RepID=A0A9D8PMB6_9DELT|nr:cobalamin-dependent protein [Candidatus Zymogenus saltonus]
MKVLLVHPHAPDVYHRLGFLLPPLGLAYLASTAREHGHEVDILDLNLTGGRGEIDFRRYDVVGISLDTSRYNRAVEIAKSAMDKGKIVVIGGPHATFTADEILGSGISDYVVRGEGEAIFAGLLDILEGGGDPRNVKGISFMRDGKVIKNPESPLQEDLGNIPFPARDILSMEKYKKLELGGRHITSLITSRGCPYNCDFCSSSKFSGTLWRKREAGDVVDEVESIVKDYGFGAVCFMDDCFTISPKRVIEICEEIGKRSIDVYWWCFSRGDIILKNEEMVRKMAESGCRYVFMGIESISDEILEKSNKNVKFSDSARAVDLLKEYNIETMGSFIIGWPEETRRMIKMTFRLSKKMGLGGVQYSILTPYPGTEIYNRYNDRIFEKDWEKFDCHHSVMRLDNLESGEIEGLLKRGFFSFYFTPRRIFRAIISPFLGRGVGLATIKKIWEYFK